jgi:hypothetical protein
MSRVTEAGMDKGVQDQQDDRDQAENPSGDGDLEQHEHDRDDDQKSDYRSNHVSPSPAALVRLAGFALETSPIGRCQCLERG